MSESAATSSLTPKLPQLSQGSRDTYVFHRRTTAQKQSSQLRDLNIIDELLCTEGDRLASKKPNYRKIMLYLRPIFFDVARGTFKKRTNLAGVECSSSTTKTTATASPSALPSSSFSTSSDRSRRIDTSGDWIWSIVKMVKNSNFNHCDFAFVKSILRDDVGDFLHVHGNDLENSSLSTEEIEILVEMCVIAKASLKIHDDVPIGHDEIFDIPDGTLTGDCGCVRLSVDVGYGRVRVARSANKCQMLYPLTSDAVRVYVDRAKKSFYDTRIRDFAQNECLREIKPFDYRDSVNKCDYYYRYDDNCDSRIDLDGKDEADIKSASNKDRGDSEKSVSLSWRLAESHRQNLLLSYGKLAVVEPKYFPARIEK